LKLMFEICLGFGAWDLELRIRRRGFKMSDHTE
jgi:hypothetical protein